MGLSVSLSNALSGMNATQRGLEVLSRNVSNAGTPGYHRQSVSVNNGYSANSSFAEVSDISRAFNEAVQRYYNEGVSNTGYADVRADFLSRLEIFIGKPGDANSIDTFYQDFENAMQALATSPDDFGTRSTVISSATQLANGLNGLSSAVQDLRQETETQIYTNVTDINRMLKSLESVNHSLKDQSGDPASRMALLDERDRLVAGISELIDTRVEYRTDDTVSLMTSSGLGLLDEAATQFEFRSAGQLNASSQFSIVDAENGVGTLTARTPAGYEIDVIEQNVIRAGRLGALIDLRDSTLVQAQDQLDEIATALAVSLSTVTTEGAAVTGPPDGFSLDLANVQPGNDFTLSYSEGSVDHTVRVVRIDDTSKLPMDVIGVDGVRTIGLDFSGGIGAVATALDAALGTAITVTNPAGSTIQIVDDGVAATSDINALVSHTTATGTQNGDLALPLFLDAGNAFSNSLDGDTQRLGFASRIEVNGDLIANNELLVKFTSTTSLGNADRANFLLHGLQNSDFTASTVSSVETGSLRLSGNAQSMIVQMMNFQGNSITAANNHLAAQELSLDAVTQRLSAEYDVNVDEEMARLIELQNAYSASARVVSVVQELINQLIAI